MFDQVKEILIKQLKLKNTEITLSSKIKDDLGADSVDLVELVMAMEEEFNLDEIQEEDLAQLKTVGDCVKFLSGKLNQ